MSRFIILGREKSDYIIFDMQDSSIELIDNNQLEKCRNNGLGIGVVSSSNHPFGIKTDENKYALFLPNGRRVYGDEFPSMNDRNDLWGHRIEIVAVGRYRDDIAIVIEDNCYCKYDIEMPMMSVHVVGVAAKSLRGAWLSLYTNMPVHITDDAAGECRECGGFDYPDAWCVSPDICNYKIDKNCLDILGVKYTDGMPSYENLCERIDFTPVVIGD